jgi:hypothetical protein
MSQETKDRKDVAGGVLIDPVLPGAFLTEKFFNKPHPFPLHHLHSISLLL